MKGIHSNLQDSCIHVFPLTSLARAYRPGLFAPVPQRKFYATAPNGGAAFLAATTITGAKRSGRRGAESGGVSPWSSRLLVGEPTGPDRQIP